MIVDVIEEDVRTVPVDILILKFAGKHRGADLAISSALGGQSLAADKGKHHFISTNARIGPKELLVLGVGALLYFDYKEIASFAQRSLELVRKERPRARHIGITIHGPGYGLDELASISSLVDGLASASAEANRADGVSKQELRISIIESSSKRAQRVRQYLQSLGRVQPNTDHEDNEIFSQAAASAISSNGTYERRLFAAMPFRDDYLDHWELAIQPAAHQNNVIIERLDHAHFTGEIVAEIRSRIERAAAVVALLDESNPNVFLEVGYAWGVRKPAVLLLKEGQEAPFDVRTQRLIRYSRIGQLKAALARELQGLLANSAI